MLTAVDAAVMVIDAAKGVEAQTIKLLNVCRMRNTPIITFVNKLDREGRAPIDLLDEVEDILKIQDAVREVPIADHVVRYVLRLVRSTRHAEADAPELVRQRVSWGAGPRASQFMILAAKTRALLKGRAHVSTEDVKAVAKPVLRHRVLLNYGAQAEGWTSDRLIDELLATTPANDSEALRDDRLPNVLET